MDFFDCLGFLQAKAFLERKRAQNSSNLRSRSLQKIHLTRDKPSNAKNLERIAHNHTHPGCHCGQFVKTLKELPTITPILGVIVGNSFNVFSLNVQKQMSVIG